MSKDGKPCHVSIVFNTFNLTSLVVSIPFTITLETFDTSLCFAPIRVCNRALKKTASTTSRRFRHAALLPLNSRYREYRASDQLHSGFQSYERTGNVALKPVCLVVILASIHSPNTFRLIIKCTSLYILIRSCYTMEKCCGIQL